MKKIIAGGFLMIAGVLLYLGIHIPIAIHASELVGYSTPPGRFGTALSEMGGTAASVFGIIMMIIGAVILAWGCFEEELKALVVMIKNGGIETKGD